MINLSLELTNSQYKLEDICLQITDGKHGDCENQENSGYYFVSVKDIGDGIIDYSNARQITKSDFEDTDKRTKLENEDILITNSGTIGKFVFVNSPLSRKTTFQKSVAIIKPNKNKIIPKFLYYYLISEKRRLIEYAGGTTQKNLLLRDIRNFEVDVPNESQQKKIIEILNNIDQLISVNKKLNKNLEEQIETLYNSFFVYYDNFSKEDLEECEIGLIPKEWKLLSLGEVTTQIKQKVGDNDYKVFSAVNTGNLILSEEYFDKQVFSKSIEKYIVVKQKEFAYNPARVNIGSIGRNDFDYDGCVSPVYVAFKVEKGYENFMNMFIKSNRFNQWVITLASGSVRQTLNYTDFSIIKIAYPPKDLIEKFNIIYERYYKLINHNKSTISNLEKIRDILLPKLMSGEIDVSKINCDIILRLINLHFFYILI